MSQEKETYLSKLERFSQMREPPRNVPFLIALSMMFDGMSVFGAVFLSFGMVFVWIFFSPSAVISDFRLNAGAKKARGVVLLCEETNMEVNERDVYRMDFEFDNGKRKVKGLCFTNRRPYLEGSSVEIEYLESEPEISRIKGTQRSQTGWMGVFTVIFPLVGFLFIFNRIKRGLSITDSLKNGILTEAEVIDSRVVAYKSKSRRPAMIELTLRYTDEMGNEHTCKHQTSEIQDVGDEVVELVLMNPSNPTKVIPIDEFSKDVDIDNRGEIFSKSAGKVLLRIAIIFLLIIPHIVYFVYHYFLGGR